LLLNADPISLICNALGEQAPGGGQLCATLQGIVSLIPADLLDQFFGTSALSAAATSSGVTSSPTTTAGAGRINPTFVPGPDAVTDDLAGMLAVR
jgi:hypothetical protein